MRPPAMPRPPRHSIEQMFEGAVLALWALAHDTLQIAQATGASEAQVYNIVARRPDWMRRRRPPF